MGAHDIVPEEDVTAAKLCGLFKRAYMKASLDDDQVTVETDGPRVLIAVEDGHRLIKFVALYTMREDASSESKHAFTNRLNARVIFARFSVPEEHSSVLVADYFLPFEEGVTSFQIVTALRLFARVVPGAIQACDQDGLVN